MQFKNNGLISAQYKGLSWIPLGNVLNQQDGKMINTVGPITSGAAQRKRVRLITQRSNDRNFPPLYDIAYISLRRGSANEKRFLTTPTY